MTIFGFPQEMIDEERNFKESLNNNNSEDLKPRNINRGVFNKVLKRFKKMFCKHKNKTETFRCYQDRYVSEVCEDCGKVIYNDL